MKKMDKDSKWIGPMIIAIPCGYIGSMGAFYGLLKAGELSLSFHLFGGLFLFLIGSAIFMSHKLRGCGLEDPGCGPPLL